MTTGHKRAILGVSLKGSTGGCGGLRFETASGVFMKKLVIFSLFIFVLSGLCYAQSANDAQRIIGTWAIDDFSLTFNANGTYASNQWGNGNYFVSNSKLILNNTDDVQMAISALILKYYLSADGKALVLEDGNSDGSGIWLNKK